MYHQLTMSCMVVWHAGLLLIHVGGVEWNVNRMTYSGLGAGTASRMFAIWWSDSIPYIGRSNDLRMRRPRVPSIRLNTAAAADKFADFLCRHKVHRVLKLEGAKWTVLSSQWSLRVRACHGACQLYGHGVWIKQTRRVTACALATSRDWASSR
jgi:hypothetical protein